MSRSKVMSAVAVLSLTVLAEANAGGPTRHETAAERLHRKGVHCMEVLERRQCAIENFELLLDEDTMQRELVTDAMLRLVKLYRSENDEERVKGVLRDYWDVGMKWSSTGHLPYSTRFFPPELTILFNMDMQRALQAPVAKRVDGDVHTAVFTCDPVSRESATNRIRWRKAERRAAREGRPVYQVVYEDIDKEVEDQRKREARRKSVQTERDKFTPIFAEAACPVALALGMDDFRGARRVTGAMYHKDFRRSMGVADIPDLDAKLADAVANGRLQRLGPDRYALPEFQFAGEAVHLAKLDKDELTMARASMMDGVIQARAERKRRMNRELEKLAGGVPKDSGFLLVMNRSAMEHLAFGQMREGAGGFLQALLPKPKGLQVAVAFGEYLGLFTRMPTDNQVKGRVLVALAERMIEGESSKDAQSQQFLKGLDVAEAYDRKALLVTYVLTSGQIDKMIYE